MSTDTSSGDTGSALRRFLRTPALAVFMAGLVITLGAAAWLWDREKGSADTVLDTRAQVLVESMQQGISDAEVRLAGVAGLYQASEMVERYEFRRFVRKLGSLPGMDAIGFMPVVPAHDRVEFEEESRKAIPGFFIFELDESGDRVPAQERWMHVPLLWFEPVDAFDNPEGFDSMSDDRRATALEMARTSRQMASSPFLQLVTDPEHDGFVLYYPVTDAETDALVGYAVAAMDLSDLMDGAVSDALSVVLSWSVTDITDSTVDDLPPGSAGVKRIEFGGRRWQIRITPSPNSDMTPNPSSALVVLVSGLVATGVLAGALHNRRRHTADRVEYEKLREITQAKDEFLASVSHELRTPLTSVLGFAELLRGDDVELTDAERRSMIASVADEAMDLAAIVEDLLVSARSELDLLVVTRVPVSARAQVAQVLEVSSKDSCAAVEVISNPTEPYTALGDPGRVRQILRNLITNACRYGGSRAQVRLRSVDDTVVIAVADNGEGVPPGDEDRIFAPYYRAHAIESQPAALGIGLSVARQLARLMDGDLRYRRDNGWTVFELLLPATTAHPGMLGSEAMTGSRLD